ncbi:MAG: 1-aminocyclopropane-1-carboxylate deaminase [Neolewinella sp.]|jgi:1-aminocyclopropane-1-carboxylate deaminase
MHLRPRPSPLQLLEHPAATAAGIALYCKRDDLYTCAPGTALQGNKVRKLEGFLEAALNAAKKPVLMSFGGAYSNHLSALATAGKLYEIPVIIFVRGEEADNPLLDQARADGARLIHLSRPEYRQKYDQTWLQLRKQEVADFYNVSISAIWSIAEGGTCPGSAKNVGKLYHEVVEALDEYPDFLCLSAGTGGSAAGVIQAAGTATRVEVFPALKGQWMADEIRNFLPDLTNENWTTVTDYHFGGYGKFPKEWIVLSQGLATQADIEEPGLPPLEPIYTAKLFYGVLDRIRKGHYPPGSSVVVVHTGGIY